ncbi:hypothetical protein ADUPG1_000896 [Aduncisulcus paluster]|uniref:Uncharacterized protein n=1 Tax=Aduncisulcus paluster TaxID=2918883 RepID=A0ABQ5K8X0_9EUKA|nr:hypothetical protein ADUPG1_000896 [Aduncisulcus paluster]
MKILTFYKSSSAIKENENKIILACECLSYLQRSTHKSEVLLLSMDDMSHMIDQFLDKLIFLESRIGDSVSVILYELCMNIMVKDESKIAIIYEKLQRSLRRLFLKGKKVTLPDAVVTNVLLTCINISLCPSQAVKESFIKIIKDNVLPWLKKYTSSMLFGCWMGILNNITLSHNNITPCNAYCAELWHLFHPICTIIKKNFAGFAMIDSSHVKVEHSLGFFASLCCDPSHAIRVYDEVSDLLDGWLVAFRETNHVSGASCWARLIAMLSAIPIVLPMVYPKYSEGMEWCSKLELEMFKQEDEEGENNKDGSGGERYSDMFVQYIRNGRVLDGKGAPKITLGQKLIILSKKSSPAVTLPILKVHQTLQSQKVETHDFSGCIYVHPTISGEDLGHGPLKASSSHKYTSIKRDGPVKAKNKRKSNAMGKEYNPHHKLGDEEEEERDEEDLDSSRIDADGSVTSSGEYAIRTLSHSSSLCEISVNHGCTNALPALHCPTPNKYTKYGIKPNRRKDSSSSSSSSSRAASDLLPHSSKLSQSILYETIEDETSPVPLSGAKQMWRKENHGHHNTHRGESDHYISSPSGRSVSELGYYSGLSVAVPRINNTKRYRERSATKGSDHRIALQSKMSGISDATRLKGSKNKKKSRLRQGGLNLIQMGSSRLSPRQSALHGSTILKKLPHEFVSSPQMLPREDSVEEKLKLTPSSMSVISAANESPSVSLHPVSYSEFNSTLSHQLAHSLSSSPSLASPVLSKAKRRKETHQKMLLGRMSSHDSSELSQMMTEIGTSIPTDEMLKKQTREVIPGHLSLYGRKTRLDELKEEMKNIKIGEMKERKEKRRMNKELRQRKERQYVRRDRFQNSVISRFDADYGHIQGSHDAFGEVQSKYSTQDDQSDVVFVRRANPIPEKKSSRKIYTEKKDSITTAKDGVAISSPSDGHQHLKQMLPSHSSSHNPKETPNTSRISPSLSPLKHPFPSSRSPLSSSSSPYIGIVNNARGDQTTLIFHSSRRRKGRSPRNGSGLTFPSLEERRQKALAKLLEREKAKTDWLKSNPGVYASGALKLGMKTVSDQLKQESDIIPEDISDEMVINGKAGHEWMVERRGDNRQKKQRIMRHFVSMIAETCGPESERSRRTSLVDGRIIHTEKERPPEPTDHQFILPKAKQASSKPDMEYSTGHIRVPNLSAKDKKGLFDAEVKIKRDRLFVLTQTMPANRPKKLSQLHLRVDNRTIHE